MRDDKITPGKVLWALFVGIPLFIVTEKDWSHIQQTFSAIRPADIGVNLLVVLIVIAMAGCLSNSYRVFSWCWPDAFGWGTRGKNLNLAPMGLPYIGWLIAIAFVINIPVLARAEEQIFRSGLQSWTAAVWSSIGFGLVHCLAGVNIGTGLAIGLNGLWLSHQYFLGGLGGATKHHTVYNLIVMTVIIGLKLFEPSASPATAPAQSSAPPSVNVYAIASPDIEDRRAFEISQPPRQDGPSPDSKLRDDSWGKPW